MKDLTPTQAWHWLQTESERLRAAGEQPPLFVDVRMEIESLYVGRPPGVENIPWYEYPDLTPDPARFAAAVEAEAGLHHLGAGGDVDHALTSAPRAGPRSASR